MTVDSYAAPPSNDEKLQLHADHSRQDSGRASKSRRLLQSTSILYPILLALLLLTGTLFLVVTITRRNTCRHAQEERVVVSSHGLLSNDHTSEWVPCVKTSPSSLCLCPASYVASPSTPSHCVPTHSRCLHSCRHNAHCSCHHLTDADRCHEVTRQWIEKEFKVGPVEVLRHGLTKAVSSSPVDRASHQLEHLLVDQRTNERLFFSADRKTAIALDQHNDDYLLNERWTKIDTNTTQQHIAYTQLNPQTHTCRLSSVMENGTATHGLVHPCPPSRVLAPYFFGVACREILVLWNGDRQLHSQSRTDGSLIRHHFESNIPHLPVLLDPFHRYYSLYDDLMLEIKDLNGDVIAQIFTEIAHPEHFEFIDALGNIMVANQTHMQLFTSSNEQAWLDF